MMAEVNTDTYTKNDLNQIRLYAGALVAVIMQYLHRPKKQCLHLAERKKNLFLFLELGVQVGSHTI